MRPLSDWSIEARQGICGVLTDIDDTLTTRGAITADALAALAALQQASLPVVAITGRPIGWCRRFLDPSLAQPPWPVAAMVAENGAVAYVKNGIQPTGDGHSLLSKIYQQDAHTRKLNRLAMEALAVQVLQAIPTARRTGDAAERETDLAFDYAEHHQMPEADVQRLLALLHDAGMHTSVSSIHVHGCYGLFDKWQGAQWIVRALYGRTLAAERERWVFVGDSGNDQALFAQLPNSVGVANIRTCAQTLRHKPTYITAAERGAGFAEMAHALLAVLPA